MFEAAAVIRARHSPYSKARSSLLSSLTSAAHHGAPFAHHAVYSDGGGDSRSGPIAERLAFDRADEVVMFGRHVATAGNTFALSIDRDVRLLTQQAKATELPRASGNASNALIGTHSSVASSAQPASVIDISGHSQSTIAAEPDGEDAEVQIVGSTGRPMQHTVPSSSSTAKPSTPATAGRPPLAVAPPASRPRSASARPHSGKTASLVAAAAAAAPSAEGGPAAPARTLSSSGRPLCAGTASKGTPCGNLAGAGALFCHHHAKPGPMVANTSPATTSGADPSATASPLSDVSGATGNTALFETADGQVVFAAHEPCKHEGWAASPANAEGTVYVCDNDNCKRTGPRPLPPADSAPASPAGTKTAATLGTPLTARRPPPLGPMPARARLPLAVKNPRRPLQLWKLPRVPQ